MRHFPDSTELSDKQRSIYQEKLDSSLLIVGPPGTGKTVLAIFRAKKLFEDNRKLNMYMYNKTLEDYTRNQTSDDYNFKKSIKRLQSYISQKYKQFGWKVPFDKDNGGINYEWVLGRFDSLDETDKSKLFPENIVIDEGQDYPTAFYKLLAKFWMFTKQRDIKFCPTVMADENQRINPENNTTITQIEEIFGSFPEIYNLYVRKDLDENYRNTKEIAEVGRKFYPGLASGMPKIPEKKGDKPKFFWSEDIESFAERVINYKKVNPAKTVGIIIPQKHSKVPVSEYQKQLRRELINQKIPETEIKIQHYVSNNNVLNELDFSSSNTITVITNQSAKGLEFDTVFIPDLERIDTDNEYLESAMTLYVILHRARDNLFLSATRNEHNDEQKYPPILSEPHRTRDSNKDIHTVGFENEAELKNFIDIEGEIPQTKGIWEESKQIQEPITNPKTRNASSSHINAEEIFDLFKKGEEIKKYLPKLMGTEQKKLLQLIQYHNKNESFKRADEIKRKRKKNNKIKSTSEDKNYKKINQATKGQRKTAKNQKRLESKTVISKNSGSTRAITMRIISIIKSAVEKKEVTEFSIVCSDNNVIKPKQDLLEMLYKDAQGITGPIPIFREIKNKHEITFSDKNGRDNKISFLTPDAQINFNSIILILGLENIRAEELEEYAQDSISSLVTLIAAEDIPPPITEFLFPDIGMEIPAEKFIKELFDDGNLTERNYEY